MNIIETKLEQKEKDIIDQNTINYIKLNKSINNLEKELRFSDEENQVQNINNFNLLNNSINYVETKLNILNYNILFFVKFNIRILADFYMNNIQTNLCSLGEDSNKIDDSRMKLIIHQDKSVGCYWDVFQNGDSFEFTLNADTALKGWKMAVLIMI